MNYFKERMVMKKQNNKELIAKWYYTQRGTIKVQLEGKKKAISENELWKDYIIIG